MAKESRPNQSAIDAQAKRDQLKSDVEDEIDAIAPPQQQIALLTKILQELRILNTRE